MYNNADCNAGAGCNTAFGRMDGKLYTGEIPFEAVESIPDGDWQASNAALVFDIEEMDGLDAEAIEAVCKELAAYGDADAPSDEDGMYSFALWNLRIRNAAQLKAFMQGCAKLIQQKVKLTVAAKAKVTSVGLTSLCFTMPPINITKP